MVIVSKNRYDYYVEDDDSAFYSLMAKRERKEGGLDEECRKKRQHQYINSFLFK